MEFLKQFFILLLFVVLGHVVALVVPVPGLILGLFFLFLALLTKIIKVESVSIAANSLIGLSGLFFVPLLVNILTYMDVLQPVAWKFIVAIVGSTIITIGMTAWSIQVFVSWQQKKEQKVLQEINNE